MNLVELKSLMDWCAVIAGFVSAGLWFWSTVAVVPYDPNDKGMHVIGGTKEKPVDHFPTVELQSKINRWAAAATGTASLFAAIGLTIAKYSN